MNQISIVGLDLAKHVFQVHVVDAGGRVVIRKPLRRSEVLKFFASLRSFLIGSPKIIAQHLEQHEQNFTALGKSKAAHMTSAMTLLVKNAAGLK